jgi:hypothetical protein
MFARAAAAVVLGVTVLSMGALAQAPSARAPWLFLGRDFLACGRRRRCKTSNSR